MASGGERFRDYVAMFFTNWRNPHYGFIQKVGLTFKNRAIGFYARHGITVERVLTDNGSPYRSTVHAIACRTLGIRHLRTRPYTPRTNGKAEALIRILQREWAYAYTYPSSTHRSRALPG